VREEFIIDIDQANQLLDEQRRVIEEVARRCLLKGKNCQCSDCPMSTFCEDTEIIQSYEEELKHASQR
jgi:hypothetical protein